MSKFSNLMTATGLAVAVIAGAGRRATPASLKSPAPPSGRAQTVLKNFVNDGKAQGSSDRKDKEAPVKDAAQAIASFQHYWESTVLDGLREGSRRKLLARTMSERVQQKTLSARLVPYREIYNRVKDTLTPLDRENLILYGKATDLDRGGECWLIESFTGCPCSELAGSIDPKTGQLMFVWIMPEG